jgi:ankyrin repeat protein
MLWCIAHKVDINYHDPDDNSNAALHIAAIVRNALASDEALLQTSLTNKYLLLMRQNRDAPVLEFLLTNGADADAWTPLHHCACNDVVDCAIVLIKFCAKLDRKDFDNKVRACRLPTYHTSHTDNTTTNMPLQTPLQIAISNEKAHCVTLLRLATQAQQEHPGNAFTDESFQQAMQMFLTDWDAEVTATPPLTEEEVAGFEVAKPAE